MIMAYRYRFMRFPQGKAKAITYSCDDGMKQDILTSSILCEYGIKGTFNLNGGRFNSIRHLTKEEVREHILSKGHEIAVHGYNHRALGGLRAIEGIKEVLDCKVELEETFDMIIRGMAYPDFGIKKLLNGIKYETIKEYLTNLDIAYARTTGFDNDRFEMPTDWHNWIPSAHQKNPLMMEYAQEFIDMDTTKFSINHQEPRLFYFWGHSYELDDEKTLENFRNTCKLIANNDKVWYATNIEVYEYTKAYESLIYSANGKTIYNPTLYEIWFTIDGKEYSIRSCERITIE